jgi:hypothetical protein
MTTFQFTVTLEISGDSRNTEFFRKALEAAIDRARDEGLMTPPKLPAAIAARKVEFAGSRSEP